MRALLPHQLREQFTTAVDAAMAADLPYVVSDWASFVRHLHDPEFQADLDLIEQDRLDELSGDDPLTDPPVPDSELGPPTPGARMFVNGREVVWVDD
ncbi:hypothetical protein NLX83_22930 [Allokutzneria sp. A3M-2-11 16]|uniref:hypothetical protein n=1 Tax=Allokutzneria sp. A3M-2-11 16 TaxID=2962043 RepID=UPI0020B7B6AC|nr:hypothetical protein [Allokutzneria sp. A3M-2-11 16]MCP3802125.1 hypothetical protein [Allokutzneria sp. A3M-2-11 16]